MKISEAALVKHAGFDMAIIGTGDRCGQRTVLVYDYEIMLGIVMARDGISYEEADDYLSYNLNAWLGDGTPIVVNRKSLVEIESILEENGLCLDSLPPAEVCECDDSAINKNNECMVCGKKIKDGE